MYKDLIKEAIAVAKSARDQAITFRTSVGEALITKDGKIFPGFNIESYGYSFEMHAEETAFVNAMTLGYRTTDFEALVILPTAKNFKADEIYSSCPFCVAFMNIFGNPELRIIYIDDKDEIVVDTILKDYFNPPSPLQIYPSEERKKSRPLSNMEPKLK